MYTERERHTHIQTTHIHVHTQRNTHMCVHAHTHRYTYTRMRFGSNIDKLQELSFQANKSERNPSSIKLHNGGWKLKMVGGKLNMRVGGGSNGITYSARPSREAVFLILRI